GREDLMDAFRRLFQYPGRPRPDKVVLGVRAEGDDVRGCGLTRLLEEMATQALREGHIPVPLISRSPADEPPTDISTFARRLSQQIATIRRTVFGVEEVLNAQLDLLAAAVRSGAEVPPGLNP